MHSFFSPAALCFVEHRQRDEEITKSCVYRPNYSEKARLIASFDAG
jgi:hypothetical protein